MENSENFKLDIYVVQNKKGQFFRAKGFGGYGRSWVDKIEDAKIYQKLGVARRQCTYWNNAYPEFGSPVILRMTATLTEVMDETERLKKATEKKIREEHNRKMNMAKWKLESAEREFNRIKQEIEISKKILAQGK